MTAYDSTTRGLLLGFKERGATALAVVLASALATAVRAICPPDLGPLLVPVPSSRTAVRARGDDVVSLLASRTARLLRRDGMECRAGSVLTQLRPVADSAGLSAGHRATNLRGALGVRPGRARIVEGARIVIVDDLVTTGATMSEARRALEGAGAEVVGAVAVAATSRRFHGGVVAKS